MSTEVRFPSGAGDFVDRLPHVVQEWLSDFVAELAECIEPEDEADIRVDHVIEGWTITLEIYVIGNVVVIYKMDAANGDDVSVTKR
jgi:hypothetical protein